MRLPASLSLLFVSCLSSSLLTGCSGSTTASPPPSQPATPPAPITPAAVTAYAHFGDSVTCGAGASTSGNSFTSLMDATVAGPSTNFCHPGDEASDTALHVYSNSNPTTSSPQTYTAMTGTNDVWLCGTYPGCTDNYTQALSASLAWLAIPASDKLLAQQSSVRTGSWVNDDTIRPGMGLASSVATSSITLSVPQKVAGRSLYVAWRATDGSAAQASIAIDGTIVDTLHAYSNGISAVRTQNGTTSTVFLKSYPLGAVGTHQVKIAVLSTSGPSDAFTFLWAGAPTATYTTTGVPHLIVGGVLSENFGLRTDVTALYDGIVQSVINSLKADGLDVQFAATHNILTAPDDYVDILHPNDSGHRKIATAFLNAQ